MLDNEQTTIEHPPFYMLHVRGKGAPVVFHESFDSAAAEAERLALKENTTVALLQGIAICVPPDTTPSWEFADNVTVACEDCTDGKKEADDLVKEYQDAKFKEILDLLFPNK